MVTPTRATIEAVLPLSVQDKRYDLVDGELVSMSPTGSMHVPCTASLCSSLIRLVE